MAKIHYLFILIVSLPILLAQSCSDNDILFNHGPEKIVVEGWIKEGDYPVVMVSTSVNVSMQPQSIDSLSKHVLNWARVAISDGEKEVVLMGSYDDAYFPPYIYSTIDLKGVAGKTYTLDVQYKEYHATATTTIPESVPLLDVTQEKVENNDTLYLLSAIFSDPPGKQYYCLFEKSGLSSQQFIKCDVGVFDDALFERKDEEIKYPVYHPYTIRDTLDRSEYFRKGEFVCVELRTLDKQSFDIWTDYQNSNALSGNFFAPYSQNISSNIHGGYGYWCGYGSSYKWVHVGENLKQ